MERERNGKDAQIARSPAEFRNEVYFLEAVGTTLVKVGWAVNVAARWADLSTMSPVPLKLLATLPGGRAREAEVHNLLAEYRHHGEWFLRSKMMDDVIATGRAGEGLDSLERRRSRYFGEFLDSVVGKREAKTPTQKVAARIEAGEKHNWAHISQFRKCKACGRVEFTADKKKSVCPGPTGRRRIRALVAESRV